MKRGWLVVLLAGTLGWTVGCGGSVGGPGADAGKDAGKDAGADGRKDGGGSGGSGSGGSGGGGGATGGSGGGGGAGGPVDGPRDLAADQISDLKVDAPAEVASDGRVDGTDASGGVDVPAERPAEAGTEVPADTGHDVAAETARDAADAASDPGTTGDAGSGGVAGSGGSSGSGGNNGAGGDSGVDTAAGSDAEADVIVVDAGDTGPGDTTTDTADTAPDTGVAGEPQSVLQRNKHPSRDGHFVQPTLTHATAAKLVFQTGFAATFTGAVWAAPLYLENGPGAKGVFLVVTTGADVMALDETTGAVVWSVNVGSPAQAGGAGCGDIHPLGILGTPVIDEATRTIYVAAAIGTDHIDRHEVHALSVDDGAERPGWPVDLTGTKFGNLTFDQQAANQRSALSLLGNTLYVAYGGHVGDCGNYHGWVMAIDTTNPANRGAWASGGRGEAIWASGGMASDGASLFAVTGNSTVGVTNHLDSEEVVRLSGLATLVRNDQNIYYPARWGAMDDADLDFGSSNPVLIDVAGASPSRYLVAPAKDGHVYFLDPTNLGGRDGHLFDLSIAIEGMSVRNTPTAYTTAQGTYVVIGTEGGAKCPVSVGGTAMMGIRVAVNNTAIQPTVAWCAGYGGQMSAIATTTDGTSQPVVWFLNNGRLTGVDGDTGAAVLPTVAGTCSGVQRFSSPIAVKGRIIVGADQHLCAWKAP